MTNDEMKAVIEEFKNALVASVQELDRLGDNPTAGVKHAIVAGAAMNATGIQLQMSELLASYRGLEALERQTKALEDIAESTRLIAQVLRTS